MKKILISVLTMIFIISMVTTIYASTASISATTSSSSVIKGKTFTVTLEGTADNNITGFKSSLSYDTSKLSIESKTAGTGFVDMSGGNEIDLGKTNSENLSKSGTLYTIVFKVLDNAEFGDTTISFTNPKFALVNEDATQENIDATKQNVTVTIKADETTAGNNSNEEKNNNSSNTNTSNNSNSNSSNKTNTTNKTTKLPQTGVENTTVMAIVALAGIAIVSYVSYRKYKNI